MSTQAVSSVNSVVGGELRILSTAEVTAYRAAQGSQTELPVNPDDLLETWSNKDNVVFGLRGDGRLVALTKTSDPTSLHDNDLWIGIQDGLPVIRYRYLGVTYTIGGSGYPLGYQPFQLPCLTPGVPRGTAVYVHPAGLQCLQAFTGAGAVATSAQNAVGVLASTPPDIFTPTSILLTGTRLNLLASEINFLLGIGTGVMVPSKRYFLSANGRWSATPLAEPGAEAVVPLGTALTTTLFQVQIGPIVIL